MKTVNVYLARPATGNGKGQSRWIALYRAWIKKYRILRWSRTPVLVIRRIIYIWLVESLLDMLVIQASYHITSTSSPTGCSDGYQTTVCIDSMIHQGQNLLCVSLQNLDSFVFVAITKCLILIGHSFLSSSSGFRRMRSTAKCTAPSYRSGHEILKRFMFSV